MAAQTGPVSVSSVLPQPEIVLPVPDLQRQYAALPSLRPARAIRMRAIRASAPVQFAPAAPIENVSGHMPVMAAQIRPIPIPPVLPQPEIVLPVPAVAVAQQSAVALRNLPAAYLPVVETQARYKRIDLKNMDVEYPKCGALHWACERLAKSRSDPATYVFSTCCLDGKVKLPILQKPPRDLLHCMMESVLIQSIF